MEFIAEYLFGVGAGERPGDIDPLADGPVIYSVADGYDHAGSVEAWRVGQFHIRSVESGTYVSIDRVDSDRLDPNHDLTRTGHKVRNIFKFHHFG